MEKVCHCPVLETRGQIDPTDWTARKEATSHPDDNEEVTGQVITSEIPLSDGVSIGPDGTLFVVNYGPGSSEDKTREVWRIPPGDENPGAYPLISMAGGTILRYNVSDRTFEDPFYSGLGNGKFKISVGIQAVNGAHVHRVYVADRNGGEVHRFLIDDDGTVDLDGTATAGIQSPVGVAAATSNATLAFEGKGQTALLQNKEVKP